MRGKNQEMPTMEVQLPIKLGKLIPKTAVTKTTKTYVRGAVDLAAALEIRGQLQEQHGAKNNKKADNDRIKKALDTVKEVCKDLAERTSDVVSLDLAQASDRCASTSDEQGRDGGTA